MYDKVVSLGYNCEVSFRIEDYFGSIDAMPFSWSFTLNRDKFTDAMREPEKLLSEGITVRDDHMLMCNRYELKFHPRYSISRSSVNIPKSSWQKLRRSLRTELSILRISSTTFATAI